MVFIIQTEQFYLFCFQCETFPPKHKENKTEISTVIQDIMQQMRCTCLWTDSDKEDDETAEACQVAAGSLCSGSMQNSGFVTHQDPVSIICIFCFCNPAFWKKYLKVQPIFTWSSAMALINEALAAFCHLCRQMAGKGILLKLTFTGSAQQQLQFGVNQLWEIHLWNSVFSLTLINQKEWHSPKHKKIKTFFHLLD